MREQFTLESWSANRQAYIEAQESGAFYVRYEHLLLGLLARGHSIPGLEYASARAELMQLLPPEGEPYRAQIPYDNGLRELLRARVELEAKRRRRVEPHHLLESLAVLDHPVGELIRRAGHDDRDATELAAVVPQMPPQPRARPSGLADT